MRAAASLWENKHATTKRLTLNVGMQVKLHYEVTSILKVG